MICWIMPTTRRSGGRRLKTWWEDSYLCILLFDPLEKKKNPFMWIFLVVTRALVLKIHLSVFLNMVLAMSLHWLTHWSRDKIAFADDIFTFIFLNGNCCVLIHISLEFVQKSPIDYKSGPGNGLVRIRRHTNIMSITGHHQTISMATFLMMTSSNGNIFRVNGHLCGEFTGHRWISRAKSSNAELWSFLWSAPEQTVE